MRPSYNRPLTSHTPPNKQNANPLYNRSASPTNPVLKIKTKIQPPSQLRYFKTTHVGEEEERDYEKQRQKGNKGNGKVNRLDWRKQVNAIGVRYCANHLTKESKFRLEVDGDLLYYCAKCAVKLASQGFLVDKLTQFSTDQIQPPVNPSQISPTQYLPLGLQFQQQIQHSITCHKQALQSLSTVDQAYRKQYEKMSNFYNSVGTFLQKLREDHLAHLQGQWRRDLQVVRAQQGELEDRVYQIKGMAAACAKGEGRIMRGFGDRLRVFNHKIEELEQFMKRIPNTSQQALHKKINNTQKYLYNTIQHSPLPPPPQKQQNSQNSQTSISISETSILPSQNQYENMPKRQTQKLINPIKFKILCENGQANGHESSLEIEPGEKKTAFRRLFAKDQANQLV